MNAADYPMIGREYTYMDEPVTVLRVLPCKGGTPDDAHCDIESRWGTKSHCKASELSPWPTRASKQANDPLTQNQICNCMNLQRKAYMRATTDDERRLVELQMLAVTTGVPDHSNIYEDWDCPCNCDECASC